MKYELGPGRLFGINLSLLKKPFFRLWIFIFIILLSVSYFWGFMPTGAREIFLALVRPLKSDVHIPSNVILVSSRGSDNASAAVSGSDSWTAPKIVIPQIEVNSPVVLSTSKNLNVLNADLLKGVVHYPDSAMPGQSGNVVLFGHTSALPIVYNNAYNVFSRLKELEPGDLVEIYSDTRKYSYVVKKVEVGLADDTRIDLTGDKKLLTLSTCNMLGGKESRYIVTAEFL